MLLYRRIWPSDADAYRLHLLRLSPVDRRARFHGAMTPEAIDRHLDRLDWARTRILAAVDETGVRAAVELCLADDGRGAEVAVSVEPGLQGQGVGTELVRRALLHAQNRGLARLSFLCLPNNRRMQRITRRFAGALDFDPIEVQSDVPVPAPTPLSYWQELLDDMAVWTVALVDTWHRAVLPAGRAAA